MSGNHLPHGYLSTGPQNHYGSSGGGWHLTVGNRGWKKESDTHSNRGCVMIKKHITLGFLSRLAHSIPACHLCCAYIQIYLDRHCSMIASFKFYQSMKNLLRSIAANQSRKLAHIATITLHRPPVEMIVSGRADHLPHPVFTRCWGKTAGVNQWPQ